MPDLSWLAKNYWSVMLNLSFFSSTYKPSINYLSNAHSLWNYIVYHGRDYIFLRTYKYDLIWSCVCNFSVYLFSNDSKLTFYEWSSIIFFFFVAKFLFNILEVVYDSPLEQEEEFNFVLIGFLRILNVFLVSENIIKNDEVKIFKWDYNKSVFEIK